MAEELKSEAAQVALAQQLAATNTTIEEIQIGDNTVALEPIVIQEHIVDDEVPPPVVAAPVAEQVVTAPTPMPETQEKVEEVTTGKADGRKSQHVTITEQIYINEAAGPDDDQLTMPATFDKETRKVMESIPNVELLDDEKTREWAMRVNDGLNYTTFDEAFVPSLEEDDADFAQSVELNGVKLAGHQPKMKQIENQTLHGERAAIRLMRHLGLGTLFQTPLWHTGIWVTFKAPTESEIVELNRQIFDDKIEMGRHTYGLVYSNTAAYTAQRLVDFALDHIYDTTLVAEEIPSNSLKNVINTQDYPSLIWGFVCTMYPRGFHFSRACVNDPSKCNHVLEALLNLSKLQWVNRAALTAWQKTHMSTRQPNAKNMESVKRYQEELGRVQEKRVVFYKDDPREIAITLKTPTLTDYIESGHRWVGDMVDMVNSALGMDASEKERNTYITRHSQASALRQYAHWIKSVEFNSNVINDRETIEKTFNILSSDNEIRNDLTQSVMNYIDHSTIAVIGIPVYDCPKCGTAQDSDSNLPYHKNIIPLDVTQLFFALITQRLTKITDR